MKNKLENELKAYYGNIEKSLVCNLKQKKSFIRDFSSEINNYINENPNCSFCDIETVFGTPEEITDSFIYKENTDAITKKLNIKKFVVIALIIALTVWALFAVISLIDVHEEAHGTFTEGIINIIYLLEKKV